MPRTVQANEVEYVVRGPAIDNIARQSEFFWQHLVMTAATGFGDIIAELDFNLDDRLKKKADNEDLRQALEKMQIAVNNIEFRLRPDGDKLRLMVRGKVTSTIPGESPKPSEADCEAVGTAEEKKNPSIPKN